MKTLKKVADQIAVKITLNKYLIKVEHDAGKCNFTVIATNEDEAISEVLRLFGLLKAENWPRSAIQKVKFLKAII